MLAATHPDPGVILIVDDTPENLALLSEALDEAGHMVLVALSGAAALQRIERRSPDLILLDAVMPGMDGFETCRQIKASPRGRDIPVLFMTALTDSQHVIQGFECGGIDYVTKPFEPCQVVARVAAHLRNAQLLQQARTASQGSPWISDEQAHAQLATRYQLTERETEVLRWLACGKTNRDIADILGLSPRTVNKHLEHIYVKLGVENRAAATSVALSGLGRRI